MRLFHISEGSSDIVGDNQAMEFSNFTSAATHLLAQQVGFDEPAFFVHVKASRQDVRMDEMELERCFDYIRAGEGGLGVHEWVSALEDPRVKLVAAAVNADVEQRQKKESQKHHHQHHHHNQFLQHPQQQDIACMPTQDYWMVKRGGEVKVFEWYFVERRRWADPVEVWLSAQEVIGLGPTKGRAFVLPVNQTTKGVMKQWHKLKIANDDGSGDIGYEQLQQLLRLCRIRATETDIKKMFQAADEDGSGSIDSLEFLSIVKSLQATGGSTGVDAGNFVRAYHGPSDAIGVVLACTHKRVLESAGSCSQKNCMFHVELHENETRSCELLVSRV